MKCPDTHRRARADLLAIVFLLVLTTTMLYPVALGDRPVSLDHTVHYYKAWQLKGRLAQGLSPYGWSNDWFAGYPMHYHYPVGAYFAVAGIYALSFGLLDFSQAYGVTLWLVYLSYGCALYFYGKRVGGRLAGVIGAFLLLTDPGSAFTGGWEWVIHVGAWPIALSMALGLIATLYLDRLMEDRSWRTVGKYALFTGLALNVHPIQLVYLSSVVPLLIMGRALHLGYPPLNRALWLRLGAGAGIGLLIGSFWLLPFFSSTGFAFPLGFGFMTLREIGEQLGSGTLFEGMWSYAQVLGLIGCLFLLVRRRPLSFFTGLFPFICLLFASQETSEFIGPFLPTFVAHFEFFRLIMLLKPFWFVAAGWLVARSLQVLWEGISLGPWPRGVVRSAVVVLLLLPIGLPAMGGFLTGHVFRSSELESQRPLQAERRDFVAWAKDAFAGDSSFFRIAHGFPPDDHAWVDLGIEVSRPFYKLSFTPATAFKFVVSASDPSMLKAVNVRYWLHPGSLDREDLRLVRSFGNLHLYEFKEWSPEPFSIIEGKGRLRVLDFSDEEIVIESEAGSSGKLRLNVAYFDRWKATLDGVPLEIGYIHLGGEENPAFMTADLKPGLYRFYYERGWPERLSPWVFFTGIGIVACLLLLIRKRQFLGAIAIDDDALLWAGKGAKEATHTVVTIGDIGLAIKKAKNVHGADVHTLMAMDAFCIIDFANGHSF